MQKWMRICSSMRRVLPWALDPAPGIVCAFYSLSIHGKIVMKPERKSKIVP